MLRKSKDGIFDVLDFNMVGFHDGENIEGVHLYPIQEREITISDIARAVEEIFSQWEKDNAPMIYFEVVINNTRGYQFKSSWKPSFEDYLIEIAEQIKL